MDVEQAMQQYNENLQGASLEPPTDPTMSVLEELPPIGDLSTTESDLGLYDIYKVETKYVQDTGKLLLPISTGSGPVTLIAKVSKPYGYKMVTFEVARANAYPKLPATEETDGCQLLNTQLSALNDVLDAANGTRIYRTAGYYLYGIKTPRIVGTDEFPVPSLPNISSPSVPLDDTDFQTGIAPEEST